MSKMSESFGDVVAIAAVLFMLYAAGSTIVQAVSKIPGFEEKVMRVWPADYRLWSTESERIEAAAALALVPESVLVSESELSSIEKAWIDEEMGSRRVGEWTDAEFGWVWVEWLKTQSDKFLRSLSGCVFKESLGERKLCAAEHGYTVRHINELVLAMTSDEKTDLRWEVLNIVSDWSEVNNNHYQALYIATKIAMLPSLRTGYILNAIILIADPQASEAELWEMLIEHQVE